MVYVICGIEKLSLLDCKLLGAGTLVVIYEPCLSSDIMAASIVKMHCPAHGLLVMLLGQMGTEGMIARLSQVPS